MNIVTAEDFDPYPGGFLKKELEDMIFKANVMLGMDYMTSNDIEGAKECIKNIYLSKYDAVPHDDLFTYFRKLQKSWQNLIKFTKDSMIEINDVIAKCSAECKISVEDITD